MTFQGYLGNIFFEPIWASYQHLQKLLGILNLESITMIIIAEIYKKLTLN